MPNFWVTHENNVNSQEWTTLRPQPGSQGKDRAAIEFEGMTEDFQNLLGKNNQKLNN